MNQEEREALTNKIARKPRVFRPDNYTHLTNRFGCPA
jgi:hypothetical protein